MGLHKFLIILTIAVLLILTVAVWFYPSNEDFKTENFFWNGTRDICVNHAALPIESLKELPISPHGTTLILIPYLALTDSELAALNTFVRKGGSLILTDDYGHGNQVLEYLGLRARFAEQALLDPLSNYKNQWFPRIVHIQTSPLTINTGSLVFNHATSLINVEKTDTIALSSMFSFLDRNDNKKRDDGEPTGPLPVISQHKLGSGQITLISDPSIFINSMQALGSNSNFVKNIAATTSYHLLIDQSHLPPSNLHYAKNLLERARGLLTAPLGILLLVISVLVITLLPIWRKKIAGQYS